MTNMGNRQTCTVGHLNLILPAIALVDLKTFQLTRQVIGGARVHMPVLVGTAATRAGRGRIARPRGRRVVVLVEAVPAMISLVPPVFANLAPGALALAAAALAAGIVVGRRATVALAALSSVLSRGGAVLASVPLLLLLLLLTALRGTRCSGATAERIGSAERAWPPNSVCR